MNEPWMTPRFGAWMRREQTKGRMPVVSHEELQEIAASGLDLMAMTYPEAKVASSWHVLSTGYETGSPKWVYLDGRVSVDNRPHYVQLGDLATEGDDIQNIVNTWSRGYDTPPTNHAVAYGELHPQGHVMFWGSNVDRNAVRDAVDKRRLASTRTSVEADPSWPPIVTLEPHDDHRHAYVVPGGEPAHQLHTTLFTLKPDNPRNYDIEGLHGLLSRVVPNFTAPEAYLTGHDKLPAGGAAHVMHVDSPDIHHMHGYLRGALEGAGYTIDDKHDFRPHMTLAYNDEPDLHGAADHLTGQQIFYPHVGIRHATLGDRPWNLELGQPAQVTAGTKTGDSVAPYQFDLYRTLNKALQVHNYEQDRDDPVRYEQHMNDVSRDPLLQAVDDTDPTSNFYHNWIERRRPPFHSDEDPMGINYVAPPPKPRGAPGQGPLIDTANDLIEALNGMPGITMPANVQNAVLAAVRAWWKNDTEHAADVLAANGLTTEDIEWLYGQYLEDRRLSDEMWAKYRQQHD